MTNDNDEERMILDQLNSAENHLKDLKASKPICEYPSVNEAARQNSGIDAKNISAAARGKIKSCGGYNWQYLKENKNGI